MTGALRPLRGRGIYDPSLRSHDRDVGWIFGRVAEICLRALAKHELRVRGPAEAGFPFSGLLPKYSCCYFAERKLCLRAPAGPGFPFSRE